MVCCGRPCPGLIGLSWRETGWFEPHLLAIDFSRSDGTYRPAGGWTLAESIGGICRGRQSGAAEFAETPGAAEESVGKLLVIVQRMLSRPGSRSRVLVLAGLLGSGSPGMVGLSRPGSREISIRSRHSPSGRAWSSRTGVGTAGRPVWMADLYGECKNERVRFSAAAFGCCRVPPRGSPAAPGWFSGRRGSAPPD